MQCDILHFSWFTMKYGFIDQRSPYQIIKLNLLIELPPLVVDRKIYTFYQISFLSWIQKKPYFPFKTSFGRYLQIYCFILIKIA